MGAAWSTLSQPKPACTSGTWHPFGFAPMQASKAVYFTMTTTYFTNNVLCYARFFSLLCSKRGERLFCLGELCESFLE